MPAAAAPEPTSAPSPDPAHGAEPASAPRPDPARGTEPSAGDPAAPDHAGSARAAQPADPWAAAAAIAHERSLRDDGAAPAVSPAHAEAPAPEPDRASADTARDLAPPPPEPSGRADVPPMPVRPALPAPGAQPVRIDDLLARPAAPWPPAAGPQTVIAADDDLKTAFFLTDSSFGPLPGETSDVMPPTSIHRPGAQAEAVTRVHGEVPPEATSGSAPAERADAAQAPPGAAASPLAPSALPGLPLRPERGAAADAIADGSPAFVSVASPFEPVSFEPAASDPEPPRAAPVPFEPAPRRAGPPSEPAIDYFPGPRRRSRGLGLALSPTAWIGAVALSMLLALQAVVGWRDAIAARVPLVAPTLAGLLGPFGLQIRPPRELDALTIEGFGLQASGAPNVLTLSAVLRNRSGHVVGYPAMELTLTDSAGALIVRKVIPPDLYVGDAATIEAGLAARSERPLRLALQHDGLQPTGFAVALFYP
jgi:hypothetical protein